MDVYTNWKDVPEHLKTKTALKKLKLRPKRGQQPVATKTHWSWKIADYDLYDMRECEPYTVSEKQQKALAKARQASVEKRTCQTCGYVQELGRHHRYKMYVSDGECSYCRKNRWRREMIEENRAEAVKWAKRLLGGLADGTIEPDEVLILDSETTDLHGEIIDLAMITLAGETVYNQRFKPVSEIAPGAEAVHGLMAETLAGEPGFASEYPKIKAVLDRARLVLIYNAAYDLKCLWHTAELHDCDPLVLNAECVMEEYARFVGEYSEYHGDYRWQRLPGGDHTALGDCQATLDVIKEMAGCAESDYFS